MAVESTTIPRHFLWFILVHHLIVVVTCNEPIYVHLIEELCLSKFKFDMEGIGQKFWCDWKKTEGSYGELTNCTLLIAKKLDCYWPSQVVDEFFVAIHKHYFMNCSLAGRSLRDPPYDILCPFIVIPILVTFFVTAMVVWRSKQNEGII
uniref:Receptor activity-modifying protein 1 n=1 Tax=Geotrypetes seraphini TaxID=260995 RepID=A0A6P8QVY2_GEOSA|nr:receptor activity-modifying protein 1 [Geotrypetes seraphini]